jgi:2-amino-4-ketopentanoate thiolase alpha subunit
VIKQRQAFRKDWVQIYRVLLEPGQRAPGIPPETAVVPLTMKVKGFLIDERAAPGDAVSIETVTGRIVSGELIAVNPAAGVDYGETEPALIAVGPAVRRLLREEAGRH